MTKPLSTEEKFPNLTFTETGRERLIEIYERLLCLSADDHPAIENIRKVFFERLQYLNDYGGPVSDEDPRPRFKVTLAADGSQLSFSLCWAQLQPETDEYEPCIRGGLQCNAVEHAFGSVQVGEPSWWSIHT